MHTYKQTYCIFFFFFFLPSKKKKSYDLSLDGVLWMSILSRNHLTVHACLDLIPDLISRLTLSKTPSACTHSVPYRGPGNETKGYDTTW